MRSSTEAPTSKRTDAMILALVLVVLAAYVVRFVRQPYGERLWYIPDDAFYYFQLGREHGRSGLWSFDGGQTLTSGFHLLHAWTASLIERFAPGDARVDLRLSLYVAFGGVLTAFALLALSAATGRLFPRGRRTALLLVGAAGGTFILPLQAMEWPLAVLASSLAVLGLASERRWLFVAAMFVGPACRFDFVVVAGCLFLAALFDARSLDTGRRRWLGAGLVASALGALCVTLHTYAINGHLLQGSARTKAFWGSIAGLQPLYGIEPGSYAFGPSLLLTRTLDAGPAILLLPLGALIAGGFALRQELAALPVRARLLARWGAITLVVLPMVYARIDGALCWYSANFVAPFFMVTAALAEALLRRRPRALPAATAVAALVAAVNAFDARRPIWPAGEFYQELRKLAADASVPRIASWNAGRIGYLGGARTIAIDGLVNDDVYPYLVADRIHCYLVHERVPVIVDQLAWFDSRRRMLGGSDGRLRAALRRREIASSILEAYDVDLAALAADPACAEDLRPPRSRAARPYP